MPVALLDHPLIMMFIKFYIFQWHYWTTLSVGGLSRLHMSVALLDHPFCMMFIKCYICQWHYWTTLSVGGLSKLIMPMALLDHPFCTMFIKITYANGIIGQSFLYDVYQNYICQWHYWTSLSVRCLSNVTYANGIIGQAFL